MIGFVSSEDMLNKYNNFEYFDFKEKFDEYKKLMNELITEKTGKERKCEQYKTKALSKFHIQGDQKFQENVKNDIDSISQLKPGRKLIKALVKAENLTIVIRSGGKVSDQVITEIGNEKFSVIQIEDDEYSYYYTCQDADRGVANAKKPRFVMLAHELIHSWHFVSDRQIYSLSSFMKNPPMLEDMDKLEEQHTIIGFNHLIFSKKKHLSHMDVLCETAFLLALGLPARVDHRLADESIISSIEKDAIIFFDWLEKKFSEIQSKNFK